MGIRRSFAIAALSVAALLGTQISQAQVGIGVSINIAPPELPVYEPPELPGPGYLWTPGYWAWADDGSGYFWVPGTWVLAPQQGYLWTPGYWGYGDGGAYLWHAGYWGPHVGFYGGVNYGYGYVGNGYAGGEWRSGAFFYNTAVVHVGGGVHITNVYNQTVVNNVTVNRVSFNGGSGGIQARATPAEEQAAHEQHLAPIAAQVQQERTARATPALRASENHGHPAIAATARPGEFSGHGVVAAHDAPARAENNRPEAARPEAARPVAPAEQAPVHQNVAEQHAPAPRPAEHAAPAAADHAAPAEHAAPRVNVARAPQPQPQHANPPHPAQKPAAPPREAAPEEKRPEGEGR